jgi:hypothetical protein
MFCPHCKKSAEFDLETPIVQGAGFDAGTGEATAAVEIGYTCSECGAVLLEGTAELAGEFPYSIIAEHDDPDHSLHVESGEPAAEEAAHPDPDAAPASVTVRMPVTLRCECQSASAAPLDVIQLSGSAELRGDEC